MALIVGKHVVSYLEDILRQVEAHDIENDSLLLDKLEDRFGYLHHYGNNINVELYGDFALWSFGVVFVYKETGELFMAGGLIYDKRRMEWSVHT